MNDPLYELLSQIEQDRIHSTLGRYRTDTVHVTLTQAGECVEIDVFDDGHMEVSRFKGSEDVLGGQELVPQILRMEAQ